MFSHGLDPNRTSQHVRFEPSARGEPLASCTVSSCVVAAVMRRDQRVRIYGWCPGTICVWIIVYLCVRIIVYFAVSLAGLSDAHSAIDHSLDVMRRSRS